MEHFKPHGLIIGWIEIVSGQPEGGSGMAKHTHCAPESRENAKESAVCGM